MFDIFDIFLTGWDDWCLANGQSQRRKSCNKVAIHSPASNITVRYLRYRDEDDDKINLSEDPGSFIFE